MPRIFFYCAVIAAVINIVHCADDVIKTSSGPVKGTEKKSYDGRKFLSFEGIPYAKPPVGDLRFKEPQPVEPWNNTLTANKKYVCLQYTFGLPQKEVRGDEDCLYLNVYVPKENIKGDENLPVLVYIHEGGFVIGDSTAAGPEYLMDKDLIIVTMNYRLGILGFLSTCDHVSPGNYGLKDQVLAMKWVRENIGAFGGNPYCITLMGTSAGAASVHYHYASPLSVGLFNRGYSQSGTMLNPWALTKDPLKNAWKLAKHLKCNGNTTQEIVDCIRKVAVKDVVLAMGEFFSYTNALPETPFGPSVEPFLPGAFLVDHPYKLLLEKRVQDLPWIASTTKDEGVIYVSVTLLHNKLQELDKNWNDLAPVVLNYNETANDLDKVAIAKLIREFYLHNEPISLKNINDLIKVVWSHPYMVTARRISEFISEQVGLSFKVQIYQQLFTDREFFIDTIKSTCLQAASTISPVYYAYFDYQTDLFIPYKANLSVTSHAEDTRLIFLYQENPAKLSDSDEKMKNILTDFVYSYAATGLPQFKEAPWFPVSSTPFSFSYMHISSPNNIRGDTYLDLAPFAFWHSLPLLESENLFRYVLETVPFFPAIF